MADRQTRIVEMADNIIDLSKVEYISEVRGNLKHTQVPWHYYIVLGSKEICVKGFETEAQARESRKYFEKMWVNYLTQPIEVGIESVVDSWGVAAIAMVRKEQIEKHRFTAENDLSYFKGNRELLMMAKYLIEQDEYALKGYMQNKYADNLLNKSKEERIAHAGALIAAYLDMKDLENKK